MPSKKTEPTIIMIILIQAMGSIVCTTQPTNLWSSWYKSLKMHRIIRLHQSKKKAGRKQMYMVITAYFPQRIRTCKEAATSGCP